MYMNPNDNSWKQIEKYIKKTQFGYSKNETQSGELQSGKNQLELDIQGVYFGATLFLSDARFSLNTRVAYSDNRSQSRTIEVEAGVKLTEVLMISLLDD